jgi:hypothetical protein
LGIFDIFKRSNTERGKEVEDEWRVNQEIQGNNYRRRAIGSDYERTIVDPYTGRRRTERWEMKRNDSPLSETQKKTRGLKVYRSYDPSPEHPFGGTRIENSRGEELERNIFTGKYRKVLKKEKDPIGLNTLGKSSSSKSRKSKKDDDIFGVGSMFGSSSSQSTSRRNDDPFGVDKMFGGSSSSKKRRRKDSNPFGLSW